MAIQTTTFTASGNFSLTDSQGTIVFSYSPTFTSPSNNASLVISTAEHLAGTTASEIALLEHNDARVYCFVKHVDTDHAVEVAITEQESSVIVLADLKPGEFVFAPMELNGDNTGDSITVGNGTSAQKVQFLLCDAIDN
tara:strand:- start:2855 stop:3271 length:417 start_codon:yes stop_codon:yes gene_type:complete